MRTWADQLDRDDAEQREFRILPDLFMRYVLRTLVAESDSREQTLLARELRHDEHNLSQGWAIALLRHVAESDRDELWYDTAQSLGARGAVLLNDPALDEVSLFDEGVQ